MYYRISCIDPDQQLLDIRVEIEGELPENLEVRMPAWRPGRYQMAHFARYIMRMEAYSKEGTPLELFKTEKDRWVLRPDGHEKIELAYSYYAPFMTAGSTYVDGHQLYVNPISSLVYLPEFEGVEHRVGLDIPSGYSIATGLHKEDERTLVAPDMQSLMDSPFIASQDIQHHAFEREGVLFHLWFQGECRPDFQRLSSDLQEVISEQVAAFGAFPEPEYHFLYQVLPYRTFHGVEHLNSTVIVIGPSYRIMDEGKGYEELIAVSSHELYHTWNVKRIRPAAMMPYDLTRENYTRLGYVAEGVTTYMGDLMLLRSGFYSLERYLEKLGKLIQRHFDNAGRHNLSVADSSFDTWLDGYDREVPGRKVSIYNEGALIAFMLDMRIRWGSNDERSLDDLMCRLYEDFYLKGQGFEEADLQGLAEELAGTSLKPFFQELIGGTVDYSSELEEALGYLGIRWERSPKPQFSEAWLGIRVRDEKGTVLVSSIFPGSPGEKAGIAPGDRIIGVNGYEVDLESFPAWCNYFGDRAIELTLSRHGSLFERTLKASMKPCFEDHDLYVGERTAPLRSWMSG